MQTLKRVGVWSLAKFGCVFGLLVYGFTLTVAAVFLSPAIAVLTAALGAKTEALVSMAATCGLIILWAAAAGAIGGFIQFLILGVIINLTLLITGGIEYERERPEDTEMIPEPKPFLKIPQYSRE